MFVVFLGRESQLLKDLALGRIKFVPTEQDGAHSRSENRSGLSGLRVPLVSIGDISSKLDFHSHYRLIVWDTFWGHLLETLSDISHGILGLSHISHGIVSCTVLPHGTDNGGEDQTQRSQVNHALLTFI